MARCCAVASAIDIPLGDCKSVRVIRDGRVPVAALEARFDDFVERWSAVAPLRVHLQIAAVVLRRGAVECRVVEDSPYFGAAEKL